MYSRQPKTAYSTPSSSFSFRFWIQPQNSPTLSGGCPSYEALMTTVGWSLGKFSLATSRGSTTEAQNPCAGASVASRCASDSHVPVLDPKKMLSGLAPCSTVVASRCVWGAVWSCSPDAAAVVPAGNEGSPPLPPLRRRSRLAAVRPPRKTARMRKFLSLIVTVCFSCSA